MIYQTDFFGNSTLGLIGILTENTCYLPPELKERQIENIAKLLNVKIKITRFYNSFLLGLFGAANSKYLFIPSVVSDKEIEGLEKNVLKMESSFNTFGNLILCNDKGIVLSPYLVEKKEFLERETKLKVGITTIANLPFPGIFALVTNKAGIVHKNCKDEELEILEKTLGVSFRKCELYEGFPGAEILANSNNLIVPKYLKARELGEIQEALQIY